MSTLMQTIVINALTKTFKNGGNLVTTIKNNIIVNGNVFTVNASGAIEHHKTAISIAEAVKIVMG